MVEVEVVVPDVGSVVVVVDAPVAGPFDKESTTVEFFGTVGGLTVWWYSTRATSLRGIEVENIAADAGHCALTLTVCNSAVAVAQLSPTRLVGRWTLTGPEDTLTLITSPDFDEVPAGGTWLTMSFNGTLEEWTRWVTLNVKPSPTRAADAWVYVILRRLGTECFFVKRPDFHTAPAPIATTRMTRAAIRKPQRRRFGARGKSY